jgi:hypothetical protein
MSGGLVLACGGGMILPNRRARFSCSEQSAAVVELLEKLLGSCLVMQLAEADGF